MSSLAEILGKGVPGNIRASDATGGSLTLTRDDYRYQSFNIITSGKNIVMPSTGIKAGETFFLENRGTADMTVLASSGPTAMTAANNAVYDATVRTGFVILRALIDTPTTVANWLVLEVYERYTYATDFSHNGGGGTSASPRTVYLTRRNDMVTISADTNHQATANNGTSFSANTAMPTRFRPDGTNVGTFGVAQPVAVGGTTQTVAGFLRVNASGLIELFRDATAGGWGSSANTGFSQSLFNTLTITYKNRA